MSWILQPSLYSTNDKTVTELHSLQITELSYASRILRATVFYARLPCCLLLSIYLSLSLNLSLPSIIHLSIYIPPIYQSIHPFHPSIHSSVYLPIPIYLVSYQNKTYYCSSIKMPSSYCRYHFAFAFLLTLYL
jgi:hypothetical protein